MKPHRAIIHGTGLLGASVGLGLRSQGWEVAGWDPDPQALTEASRRGAIGSRLNGPDTDADLVVLAAPPDAVARSMEQMDTETLITDIAGVKTPIVAAASHLPHFVGGHPMAGGETSGASLATRTMFHGATWVLTSDGTHPTDVARMEEITRSLGANPLVMTAEEHDRAVARVSHLPHVLAAALMRLADADRPTLGLAGGGFRDLTRIAAGDSTWWAEVLTANASQVGASIEELQKALDDWRRIIGDNSDSELDAELEAARVARAGLGEHHTQVRVVLLDQPGEIARVGHALETSRVDVRDFQLRHGEHGGGGVLTISVKGNGKDALTNALVDEGFEVRVGNQPLE
ncbi:MAG TPA: prephenate dehydrogenase/arogenate dehydrogenase family protein [Acidimicrobiia bacterium]